MQEEANITLYQRRENGCSKKSIYTLTLLPNIWNRLQNAMYFRYTWSSETSKS